MFLTINYRHGWIHCSAFPGCAESFSAQAPHYRVLGEFKSLHAAKLAITRDAKRVAAERAEAAREHHASIQRIVTGG